MERMDDDMLENVEDSTDSPLVEPITDDEPQTMEGKWARGVIFYIFYSMLAVKYFLYVLWSSNGNLCEHEPYSACFWFMISS